MCLSNLTPPQVATKDIVAWKLVRAEDVYTFYGKRAFWAGVKYLSLLQTTERAYQTWFFSPKGERINPAILASRNKEFVDWRDWRGKEVEYTLEKEMVSKPNTPGFYIYKTREGARRAKKIFKFVTSKMALLKVVIPKGSIYGTGEVLIEGDMPIPCYLAQKIFVKEVM